MAIWQSLVIAVVGAALGIAGRWLIGIWERAVLLRKLKNAMLDREQVSVNEEFLMTRLLAQKIKKAKFSPDVIFGICPGGAMVAEWLSRRFLGSRDEPIRVYLINMHPKPHPPGQHGFFTSVVDEKVSISWSGEPRILLVNDISRGGQTLRAAAEFLKGQFPGADIKRATLICYRDTNEAPDYCAAITRKTVRFDWKEYEKENGA